MNIIEQTKIVNSIKKAEARIVNRINGYVTQHNEAYEYYIEWEEFNINQQANTSSVRATSYIKCNSHTSWANNKTQKYIKYKPKSRSSRAACECYSG